MEKLYSIVNQSEKREIETDRLCSHFKEMVHDITCQICLNVVYPQPVCCGNCQKLFCKNCIDDWKKKRNRCPNDHDYLETQVNPLAKNLIDNFLLTCRNKGCTTQIKYGNYLKHIESECDFSNYMCHGCKLFEKKKIIMMHVNVCELMEEKCGFCSLKFMRKYLPSHIKDCNERIIECEDCDKIFKKNQFITHEKICEEKIITCQYCKMKYKRINEIFHTKDVCFRQLMKNIPANNQNNSQHSSCNKLLKEKDCQIAKLEAEKRALEKQVNFNGYRQK
jgi:hypothetical protein